jgi:NADPH-dependent glutamate synthase beta subunit-like oxidoreductase
MGELNPILDKIIEKCIGDELPFCVATCPLHVDMKGAIALIRDGKYEAALTLIREKLPFAGVLGRICTHPCEDKCQRKDVDTAIAIMALKRAAADYGKDAKWDLTIGQEKTERVAIVGSGPAGLMSAYELRRMGYQVTIFEALPVLGGMLAIGIPQYRLPRDILQQELNIIERLGIQVRLNTRIGEDIKVADLKKDYNAVFIAPGTTMSRTLSIEGSDLDGVRWGMDFLREVSLGKENKVGNRVVVVGGGNVAVDVALTALRLGTKEVQMACLECRAEMPAFKWEVQQLLDEGIILHPSWGPKLILGSNGRVAGIEMVCCTSVFDKEGKFNPSMDESKTLRIDTDSVILAIGQAPDTSFITEDSIIKRTRGGYIIADENTLATNVPGVFAGGDGVYGPKSVIEALASGKKAAISIDRYLRGEELSVGRQGEGPQDSRLKVNLEGKPRKDRVSESALPVEQRKGNFLEVEQSLIEEQAREEAERCLSCECKLCIKDCEFLKLYCQTPKELAQKFKAGYFRENPVVPYSCNLCELCGKLCPEELCSGDMCMAIRELMVKENIGPLPPHQFVRRDQDYATSDAVTLSKSGDTSKGEWAFFPGCSLPGSSPELVIKIHNYLQQKLPGTGIILRCCGAPTHCLGDHAKFENMAEDIAAEVKKVGASGLIVACPDCYRTIKRSAPGFKIKSLYEVMVEKGLPDAAHALAPKTFSLHDSCTARDETTFIDNVRTLINEMGYQLEEMKYSRDKTRCCGAGGMIPYVNLELFTKLAKQRAEEAAFDVITYCAACCDTFASTGKPAIHILELMFNSEWETGLRRPPQTGKAKRDKQAELKRLISSAPLEK